jgi:hypothetical protein
VLRRITRVDLSYFNIMGTAVGAHGVEASSEAAVFPNVDLEVAIQMQEG